MNKDTERGTGRTTKALIGCPYNAFYMVNPGAVLYTQHLARHLGREDIKIVTPEFVDSNRWRGLRPLNIVVDHYCPMTGEQDDKLHMIKSIAKGRG